MSQSASRPTIGYWIFNYMPHWEAASKEVHKLLSAVEPEFRARLMALNMTGQRLRLDNRYQAPCHTMIRQHFREDECRRRYLKIYRAVLAEADEPG